MIHNMYCLTLMFSFVLSCLNHGLNPMPKLFSNSLKVHLHFQILLNHAISFLNFDRKTATSLHS